MKKIKIDFSAFQRFWVVAKPYWSSEEKWGAICLLFLIITLTIVWANLGVFRNAQQGQFISSLAEQDAAGFWQAVQRFLGVYLLSVPVIATVHFTQDKLRLFWRNWMTNRFLNQYLSDRAFYDLNSEKIIDNPDQRISEDIRTFCDDSVKFFTIFTRAIMDIISYGAQLWFISHTLVISMVFYAFFGILITMVGFGSILIPLKFQQRKKEANFRFGLVRIRENAESIAFYQGALRELENVKKLLQDALRNYHRIVGWERNMEIFSNGYEFIAYILPALIVGPMILSGQTEVGVLTVASGAFFRVFRSLIVMITRFEQMTDFVAGIERIESFSKLMEEPKVSHPEGTTTIDTVEDSRLSLQHLTLQTPNYQRTLVRDVSVDVQLGEGLLIVGVSGCGKSSILRAIAGLWKSGTGAIYRAKLEEILFLPQRPYIILSSLRDQLLYPRTDLNISDAEIYQVLKEVNLPDLAERLGGLDAIEDWEHVLSIGEQQRVAFARLLLTQPRYAILDEATSALDVKNEQNLYKHLQSLSTTYISVGHRPTLLPYHQQVLEVVGDETWRVSCAQDYKFLASG
ncbi:ABC transporter ATP-binding protein/permease [Dapis sp. BLCC M172]|uniref:ABC transporter ATP-binding protein/permease n=1 Tax=Dapis sp. BLCC M172 TaxID=2975281 RepID=UPI003CE6E19E